MFSRLETDPPGATAFVDGRFVGVTPTTVQLPARRSARARLELPGYAPVEVSLDRAPGTPEDAEPGVGWEPAYFWRLVPDAAGR